MAVFLFYANSCFISLAMWYLAPLKPHQYCAFVFYKIDWPSHCFPSRQYVVIWTHDFSIYWWLPQAVELRHL